MEDIKKILFASSIMKFSFRTWTGLQKQHTTWNNHVYNGNCRGNNVARLCLHWMFGVWLKVSSINLNYRGGSEREHQRPANFWLNCRGKYAKLALNALHPRNWYENQNIRSAVRALMKSANYCVLSRSVQLSLR